MKPGHLDTAIKTELGHINTMFYWFINLKMNVDYKTALIFVKPILDSMVPYLLRSLNGVQLLVLRPQVRHKWYPMPKTRMLISTVGAAIMLSHSNGVDMYNKMVLIPLCNANDRFPLNAVLRPYNPYIFYIYIFISFLAEM